MSLPAVVVLEPPAVLTKTERLQGRAAVSTARLLLTVTRSRPAGLERTLRLLRRGAHPATPAQAQRTRAIVTTVSLRCASPHGCLLRSVSIAVGERLVGRSVRWQIGIASPPMSSHAWIEAGHPVGEPVDPHLFYTPILTVEP